MQLLLTSELRLLILAILICATQACTAQQSRPKAVRPKGDLIQVSKATSALVIDGKLTEADWKKTRPYLLDHFYRVEQLSDKQETRASMLWDENYLYFSFEAEDQFITAREKDRDGTPYFDDCAEVFLIPTADKINFHFGFEVNLYKTSNDFVFLNSFYDDYNVVVKAYDPDFEVGISIDGTLNDNSDIDRGWTMEIAIPITALRTVGKFKPLTSGTKWAFLLVRQDRNDPEGDRRSTSTLYSLSQNFKDVHDPQFFGLMEFVDQ